MKLYDVLGNELKEGDKVITISKNGRSGGGSLVVKTIKIENGKLGFVEPSDSCYSRSLETKVVKVFWSFVEYKEEMDNEHLAGMTEQEMRDDYNEFVTQWMRGCLSYD